MSKKWNENLQDSKKRSTFASAYKQNDRDLAQLVAHTSGGREVAGSSPVIPTKAKELKTKGFQLLFFFSQFYSILARVTEIVTESVTKIVTYLWTLKLR